MPKRKLKELDSVPLKSSKLYNNNSCPFTLKSPRELNQKLVLKFTNGNRYFYDIEGIYKYIFEFFIFKEPFTRLKFTFEQLDYILFKSYECGIIKGEHSYLEKKLRTPTSIYSFNISSKFYYITRVYNCLRENDQRYTYIRKFIKRYFCSTENYDEITGNYLEFPVVVHEDYYEKPINSKDFSFMVSKKSIPKRNKYDPISGVKLNNYYGYELVKLKETHFWNYYHIETLYNEVFENLSFGNLGIQQIDFLCYKYNEYLNILKCGIEDSPYNYTYKRYSMHLHGKYYKINYICRINKFICLYDEKAGIYNSPNFLSKFWGEFYLSKGITGCKYIPWCLSVN